MNAIVVQFQQQSFVRHLVERFREVKEYGVYLPLIVHLGLAYDRRFRNPCCASVMMLCQSRLVELERVSRS